MGRRMALPSKECRTFRNRWDEWWEYLYIQDTSKQVTRKGKGCEATRSNKKQQEATRSNKKKKRACAHERMCGCANRAARAHYKQVHLSSQQQQHHTPSLRLRSTGTGVL